ncbi:MAG: VWA domain-containing protein [Candidatus Neomarinimicrobiota bacterium]|nr:VWA domain-containing protein [Candidatus Neomarinimicrobiota bacterium]
MFEFRYPFILIAHLFVVAVMILNRTKARMRETETARWGEEKVRRRLFSRLDAKLLKRKYMLEWWGVIFLIFAASGPQIGTSFQEVERKGVDILVALDVSGSMMAEDVKPTRLEKAKFEIGRLISQLEGDRIGLVVFAGTSHLYLPLTGDYEAARLFVNAVDTEMVRSQGTALSDALLTSLDAFPKEEQKHKTLIVISDGEDHEGEAVESAKRLAEAGVVVHSVGVGTNAGALIPIYDAQGRRTDYKKDRGGKLVTSTLNDAMLREVASTGRGVSVRFDGRSGSMDDVLSVIETMEKRTLKTHEYSQFEDRYGLFLACAFFFFVVDFLTPTRKKTTEVWKGRFV